ncbi:hypothetical protein BKP66_08770 [Bacillus amyloliquefaciens]|uniref:Uncharacterized protein n=1 Tax=Bacillus amyloliquefaciens TaxID=1390 RepID=A0AAP7TBY5_BACAM|nr:hypothetical protein BKP66_08770 [Bacillus amyloliquefaciens]
MRTGFQKAPDCCRTSAFCSFRGTFVFGAACPGSEDDLPRAGKLQSAPRRKHHEAVSRFTFFVLCKPF